MALWGNPCSKSSPKSGFTLSGLFRKKAKDELKEAKDQPEKPAPKRSPSAGTLIKKGQSGLVSPQLDLPPHQSPFWFSVFFFLGDGTQIISLMRRRRRLGTILTTCLARR